MLHLELETMTVEECWQRLGAEGVGRIGFDRGRGPRIHPVNYTAAAKSALVRTSESSELSAFVHMFADGAFVSFEVDQADATTGANWSVLMTARVERLTAEQKHALASGQVPIPAPSGPHPVLLRLSPTEITGRRLVETTSDPRVEDPQTRGRLGRLGDRSSRHIPTNWLG